MITLKTLPQASAQEVFDQVAKHLLTQMKKSEDDIRGVCQYRNKNGLKCAAGCLIGDDEYDPQFDEIGNELIDTAWSSLIEAGLVPSDHSELIADLQQVHDVEPPSIWHSQLNLLSRKHNLQWNFK